MARLFIAVPLPKEIKTLVLAGRQALLPVAPRAWSQAKWVGESNLHITLRFLGEVEPKAVARVKEACAQACSLASPVVLSLGDLEAFSSFHSLRTLVVKLREGKLLEPLVRSLSQELSQRHIGFDTKPFKAHLTLARMRSPQELSRERAALETAFSKQLEGHRLSFDVSQVVLFQSVLRPTGPTYSQVSVHRLAADLQ